MGTVVTGIVAVAAAGYNEKGDGSSHSIALTNSGKVIASGYNHVGQGTVPNLPELQSGVKAIAAGAFHNLAVSAEGKVVAWGGNGNGQTKRTERPVGRGRGRRGPFPTALLSRGTAP